MLLRAIFFWFLNLIGIPYLMREFVQKNKVSILLFHDLNYDGAESVFLFLKKHYNIINLDDYIEAKKNKKFDEIPEKALIITFDDGHKNNYKLLPLIKKHSLPITIFLCSGIINTKRNYWFKLNIPNKIKKKLKRISNKDRLDVLLNYNFSQEKEFNETNALTKEEIFEMKEHVNFQSHTVFHPCLPKCSKSELLYELSSSKEKLEDEYELKINTISYPNGDYDERVIEFSMKCNYTCGITVDPGYNSLEDDLFKLKRISTNDTLDINELAVKSSGFWSFLQRKMQKK
tara:strand:+ start:196 stop:1059 length:864 start_codon:yes stop_codon:yes gene_type:complete